MAKINEGIVNFSLDNMLFYNEEERKSFVTKFTNKYKDHISKINGQRVIGGKPLKKLSDYEKDSLGILDLNLRVDEENNIVFISGHGQEYLVTAIMSLAWELFLEHRVVTYEGTSDIKEEYPRGIEEKNKEEQKILVEKRRRLELFKNGLLEPPVNTELTDSMLKAR